ncbi:MAG: adenylate kinase family protein [Candidatus Paceibacteria bacterium]
MILRHFYCNVEIMSQPKTYVFFGIIGSGKGTQIDLLKKLFKDKYNQESVYAYPGAMYRKLIEDGNHFGNLVKASMDRGELQPDLLTTSLVVNVLINSYTPDKILFFDGYPRTIEQSKSFETLVDILSINEIEVVYIELSKEEAMRRNLARGRTDDTEEAINKRFDEYVNNVVPAMKYFEGKPNYSIHTINGDQSIEKVHEDIIKALNI